MAESIILDFSVGWVEFRYGAVIPEFNLDPWLLISDL